MTILVTGASGHLGRLVVTELLSHGVPADQIRAGARDVQRIADLARRGVQMAVLDYDRPTTVQAAVQGAERVLLVSGSEVGRRVAQHRAVIDAAASAGVQQLAYTSAPFATTSQLILAPEHKATEEAIAAAGVPATILRNNWYSENYLPQIAPAAATGVLVGSAGAGRVASASRRDYAAGAAAVLTEEGHVGRVYELAGDEAWSFDDLAAAIRDITGAPVQYRSVSTEEHAATLRAAGLDEGTIGFLTGLDANIAAGALDFTDGTLSRLIGRPTTPLVQGLRAAMVEQQGS